MSDLIERQDVIDFLKLTRDSEYEKSMSAEVKHKSVIRSKHDAHVAFCDYLIEYVNQVPTHSTPSNTLGALDCVSREDLTKGIETYFGDLPIAVHYDMLALAQRLPAAQPKTQKLLDDGTLIVHTDIDITKITRVNITQNNTHYGDLFYRDEE